MSRSRMSAYASVFLFVHQAVRPSARAKCVYLLTAMKQMKIVKLLLFVWNVAYNELNGSAESSGRKL